MLEYSEGGLEASAKFERCHCWAAGKSTSGLLGKRMDGEFTEHVKILITNYG